MLKLAGYFMVFRAISGLMLFCLSSMAVWADELKINPEHPEQYTVVKGDSLWEISGKFLQHPWQWPQLWKNNPQIKDPHWIYPGDTLYFSYVDGVPSLSLARTNSGMGYTGEDKIEPTVRESPIQQAIKIIPTDAISQFLISPKVVSSDELKNAPYVIGIATDERLIAGAGDRVYVRAIEQPAGLAYTIFRQGEPYFSPQTHELLGYEAEYLGEAILQAAGDPATLLIKSSRRQVQLGDRLIINNINNLALNYFPRPPDSPLVAQIIRVMGGITQIGQHDIVVIDKGKADGLEEGHTLDIFRNGRVVVDKYHSQEAEAVKLPDELAGVLMVFRVFDRVSYALVMEATGAIHVFDRVQTHDQ